MASQRFCLRWNNHQSNLLSVFDQLLHAETFTDVTLAIDGQTLKAHKVHSSHFVFGFFSPLSGSESIKLNFLLSLKVFFLSFFSFPFFGNKRARRGDSLMYFLSSFVLLVRRRKKCLIAIPSSVREEKCLTEKCLVIALVPTSTECGGRRVLSHLPSPADRFQLGIIWRGGFFPDNAKEKYEILLKR